METEVAKVISSILAVPGTEEHERRSFEELRQCRGDQWIVDNQEFLKKDKMHLFFGSEFPGGHGQ